MAFYIGQKVVCINDRWDNPLWNAYTPNRPVKKEIYTVRAIVSYGNIGPGILLNEIHNPIVEWREITCEGGFLPHRFRPVIERKTDISIFTKMLTPDRVDA